MSCDGITLAVDQFHGHLSGLLLAEVELGIDEARMPSPHFAALGVTNDDRFSGGALAFASDEALSDLLSEAGCAG